MYSVARSTRRIPGIANEPDPTHRSGNAAPLARVLAAARSANLWMSSAMVISLEC